MLLYIGVQANYFKVLENNTTEITINTTNETVDFIENISSFLYNLLKTHKVTLIKKRHFSEHESRLNLIKVDTSSDNINYILKTIQLQDNDTLYINPFKNNMLLPFNSINNINNSDTNEYSSSIERDTKIYILFTSLLNILIVDYKLTYQIVHISVNFTILNNIITDKSESDTDKNTNSNTTTTTTSKSDQKFIIDKTSLYIKFNLFLPSIEYSKDSNNNNLENDSLTLQFTYINNGNSQCNNNTSTTTTTTNDTTNTTLTYKSSILNDMFESFISFIIENEKSIEKTFFKWLYEIIIKDFI